MTNVYTRAMIGSVMRGASPKLLTPLLLLSLMLPTAVNGDENNDALKEAEKKKDKKVKEVEITPQDSIQKKLKKAKENLKDGQNLAKPDLQEQKKEISPEDQQRIKKSYLGTLIYARDQRDHVMTKMLSDLKKYQKTQDPEQRLSISQALERSKGEMRDSIELSFKVLNKFIDIDPGSRISKSVENNITDALYYYKFNQRNFFSVNSSYRHEPRQEVIKGLEKLHSKLGKSHPIFKDSQIARKAIALSPYLSKLFPDIKEEDSKFHQNLPECLQEYAIALSPYLSKLFPKSNQSHQRLLKVLKKYPNSADIGHLEYLFSIVAPSKDQYREEKEALTIKIVDNAIVKLNAITKEINTELWNHDKHMNEYYQGRYEDQIFRQIDILSKLNSPALTDEFKVNTFYRLFSNIQSSLERTKNHPKIQGPFPTSSTIYQTKEALYKQCKYLLEDTECAKINPRAHKDISRFIKSSLKDELKFAKDLFTKYYPEAKITDQEIKETLRQHFGFKYRTFICRFMDMDEKSGKYFRAALNADKRLEELYSAGKEVNASFVIANEFHDNPFSAEYIPYIKVLYENNEHPSLYRQASTEQDVQRLITRYAPKHIKEGSLATLMLATHGLGDQIRYNCGGRTSTLGIDDNQFLDIYHDKSFFEKTALTLSKLFRKNYPNNTIAISACGSDEEGNKFVTIGAKSWAKQILQKAKAIPQIRVWGSKYPFIGSLSKIKAREDNSIEALDYKNYPDREQETINLLVTQKKQ